MDRGRLPRFGESRRGKSERTGETTYYSAERIVVSAAFSASVDQIIDEIGRAGLEAWQPYPFSPIIYVEMYPETAEEIDFFVTVVGVAVRTAARIFLDRIERLEKATLPRVVPNDPSYEVRLLPNGEVTDNLWSLQKIGCLEAWAISQGSPKVTVAVLDTGISNWSGEFDGRIRQGYNFVDDNEDCLDLNGHGTSVASIIAAKGNNDRFMAGLDWNCKILPVKIIDENNFQFESKVAAAIDFAVSENAKVINMSFLSYPTQLLREALQRAKNAEVVVVAGAGNRGSGQVNTIGVYPGVITVGSSNKEDSREVSNWGRDLDILAPGIEVRKLSLKYSEPGRGTSLATSHVSGTAALILSVRPDLTAAEVEALIYSGAEDLGEPGWDAETGWGRLNVRNSLILARTANSIELDRENRPVVSWEVPQELNGRIEYRVNESNDLRQWADADGADLEATEFRRSWKGENEGADSRFFRVEARFVADFEERAVRLFDEDQPFSVAPLLAREIDAYEPREAAIEDYETAKATALSDGLDEVPGYYLCRLRPEEFPYLVRYERGGERWHMNTDGFRLQQVAESLSWWGTTDQISDLGVVLSRDPYEVSPSYAEWDAQLQEQFGPHYLFIPECGGKREPPFVDVPFAVYYPSAGELLEIDEDSLTFVARLPDDLRDWLAGCSMISAVESISPLR